MEYSPYLMLTLYHFHLILIFIKYLYLKSVKMKQLFFLMNYTTLVLHSI